MEGLRSLAQIAPGVFKPGYREAMNQRGRLVPSIAKSIGSILRLSDNLSLRHDLAVASGLESPNLGITTPSNDKNMNAMLHTTLWRIAQKQLYNAPSPKQLNRPQCFLDLDQNGQNQDRDLLLGTSTAGTDHIGDGYHASTDWDLESSLFPDRGSELIEFNRDETGGSNSSMIFGGSHTDRSPAMSELDPTETEKDMGTESVSVFTELSDQRLPNACGIADLADLDTREGGRDMVACYFSGGECSTGIISRNASRFFAELFGSRRGDEMLLEDA
ncbi:uncharacterized protein BJX67DRAFT_351559 [Aspergillus lucknowensis]|uniref:Uncharacterized protein n=1 Tax=Aspergillus lucknowensis TaxID=176173 RepID=A0ABR4LX18_9EURO